MTISLDEALGATNQILRSEILTEAAGNLSTSELKAIRKWTRRDVTAEEVYTFPALAIDTNPTRNGVIYSAESQKLSVRSWVGVPFLFNANADGGMLSGGDHALVASSQVARIYKAQIVETTKGNIGTLVWVFTFPDVSDEIKEFCNKIDAGILREVSIHVMARQVECSICGETPNWDHEHQKGEKYGKETAYIKTVGALEPLELSSVACPGSIVAHVMDDSEVSKYTTLREALSGSHSPIEAFMDTENIETPPETAPITPEVTHTEDGAPVIDPIAEAKKDGEPDEDDAEDDAEAKKKKKPKTGGDDPTSGGTPVGKTNESLNLFEGVECPVCHREDAPVIEPEALTEAQREAILAPFREEITTKINAVMTAAKERVDAAESALTIEREQHSEAADIFKYYVTETVDLAVEKGFKTAAQREEYSTELVSLSFKGVRAVRETMQASHSKADANRNQLQEIAKARYQFENTSPDKQARRNGRVSFAATIKS